MLPYELWEHIVSFLENGSDIYHLSLANSALHAPSERQLYVYIQPRGLVSVVLLARALQRDPHLGKRVRSLDLISCAYSPSPQSRTLRRSALARLLHRLLLLVPNLERLVFPVRWYLWDPYRLPPALPRSLKTLELDLRHEGLYGRAEFLRSIPQLQHLYFREWNHTLDIDCLVALSQFDSTDLPDLKTLLGPRSVINALVQGRPVTTIHVEGPMRTPQLRRAGTWLWAQSTGPVKALSLELVHLGVEEIDMICAHMIALERLKLISKNMDGSEAINILTSNKVLASLGSLPNLYRLALYTDTFRDLSRKSWVWIGPALQQSCGRLMEVELDGKSGDELGLLTNVRLQRIWPDNAERRYVWRQEDRFISRW